MSAFRSIDELVRVFAREKVLLKEMFTRRKTLSFRYDYARSLVDYKEERIRYLIEYGVVRDSGGGVLEMGDVYLKFFEQVLELNDDINVGAVSDTMHSLEEQIRYYLAENSDRRKSLYLKEVRTRLRSIALMTLRNVIDLKRGIDNTYKNEPNYKVKKQKLQDLDAKRSGIAALIKECEKLLDGRQQTFFAVAMDVSLNQTVQDVRCQLREAYHNLLELDRQIIEYLNIIEYQSRIVEKIRRVKYLSDQLTIESQTDVLQRLQAINPIWMEPRPVYRLKLSIDMLRGTDEGLAALRDAASRRTTAGKSRNAPPLEADDLNLKAKVEDSPNVEHIFNGYRAVGGDLYTYVMAYNYPPGLDREQRRVIYCQIASQFADELEFAGRLLPDQDGCARPSDGEDSGIYYQNITLK